GETFTATLSNNSAGSTIADGTATGTILDDGTGPGPFDPSGPGTPDNDVPTLSVSSPSVGEGGQMEFTISLSNPSIEPISFSVATVDTGSATDTTDYSPALEYFNTGSSLWEPVTGDLSFAPGDTTLQVRSATVQDALVEGPESFDLTATVTGGTTTNSNATGTGTITDDDHIPDAVNSSASTLEDTTLTFSAADFGFSDADAGNSLQAVRIESLPTDGTLFFNGVEITAANLTSFNGGSNEISNTEIGLLTFEPALNDSGYDSYNAAGEGDQLNDYDSFTFGVSDGVNWSTSPATLTIDVTPVADAPTLTVDGVQSSGGVDLVDLITVPASEGLIKTVYTNVGISPATIDSNTIEAIADGLTGGTTTVETQPYRAGGNGVDNIPVDNLEVTTGVIYLEAGTTLSFNGYSDDAFRIELGGTTLIDTTGDAYGDYDTSTVGTAAVGSGTVSTYGDFTAASTGYYTFEMYIYNHIGAGDLSVNVSVNGGASQPFDTAAVNMYTGIDAVDAAQGQHSDLILTSGSDGGYYPVELNKGYEGSPIKLSAINAALVDTDGSEVLSSIVISAIPEGSVLTDGTNSFTATAGNTEVDVTSWNLDNLSYTANVDLPEGQTRVDNIVVTATSQEIASGAVVDTATQVANLDITVIALNNAPQISSVQSAVVSEEGLPAGVVDNQPVPGDTTNAAEFTGTYTATDIDTGDILTASLNSITTVTTSDGTPLSSGGEQVAFALSSDGHTLTGSAGGSDVIRISIADDGTYAVTLLGPVDHAPGQGENRLSFDLGFQVSDGTVSDNGTINITIEDDQPVSGDIYQSLVIDPQNTNLMFVIDTSGSMAWDAATGSNTITTVERMELLLTSILEVINTYDAMGDVKIQLVTFDSGADSTYQSVWLTVDEAKALIGDGTSGSRDPVLEPNGGTDYDVAVATAQTAFAADGKLVASDGYSVANVSYFLSDGKPTTAGGTENTTGITGAEITQWQNFLTSNAIDSYAVGFGSGLTAADQALLDPLAYDGAASTDKDGVIVTDSSQLSNELLSTIQPPVIGGIFGSLENNGFGADDGAFLEIEMDGITYTYDPAANGGTGQIDLSSGSSVAGNEITIDTAGGATLTLNFVTGQYQYVADADLVMDTQVQEVFTFTSTDNDGDTTSGTVTLNVSRGIDTDGDGIINSIDVDDDNDGILDTVEDANGTTVTTTTPFSLETPAANIAANGGTGSQTIDMSAYGVAVGDTVTISNIFAKGDLNNTNEWFNLSFDNGVTNTGNLTTGFQDNAYHPILQNVSITATVVDVGGVPSIVVTGQTGSGSDSFGGFVGVDYYFTLSGVTTVTTTIADADGDGIINSLDIDSDNDGIADNIEAQTNAGYITSSGIDADHDGLDDAYEPAGQTPVATNGTPDYLTPDSDGDGTNDGLSPASSGDDRLVGSAAADTIDGLDGNDALIGLDGDDTLIGGIGNDILVGGAGDDLLMGGSGSDFFDWNGGDEGIAGTPATDHITDFSVADDTLDLSDLLDSLGLATQGGVVESYLSLTENASNQAVLNVKDSAGGSVVQEIVLDNVSIQDLKTDLSIDQGATNNDLLNQLIDQSKLIV
ncbi:beta strand repeat-containing protein, partial [Amphritea pacifica]|nr:hypothetical protein [Amphritea pacifica]